MKFSYKYDYFISYSHADNKPETDKPGFVDEFAEKLRNSPEHRQMFGEDVSVFFDNKEIRPMSDWDNCIRSSLSESRFFVALLSPNYFRSKYCAMEFNWWMQHEAYRRVLGEGTAPILIVSVNDLYNYNVNKIPEISKDVHDQFPNWTTQIRQIQSGPAFDMHNLERAKIDEILRALCENTKDKYFKQKIAEYSPINAGYPQFNKDFVGRREELRLIRQTLSTSPRAISAINGLGGIGKTELALTYGHAFAWDYGLGLVFAACENADSLEEVILSSGIAEMHGLKLEGSNNQKLTTLYNALKYKIQLIEERNKKENIDKTLGTHILLILDNVNRLELISQRNLDKIPDFFHVIITTRESDNDFPYIYPVHVNQLTENESVELLSNLRSFGDDELEIEAAKNIAKLLDGYTLAVELTGAFLRKFPSKTYQRQYERLKANISGTIDTMVDKTQELRRHQAQCISAVLESTLSELSDNARKALDFAAFMAPDAVGFSWLPELLGLDEDNGGDVLDDLTGYNLLTRLEKEPHIARIHRLVAEEIKKEIPEDIQKEIVAKIREKCNTLLKNDKMFWCSSENSWNITPVSEFCLELAKQWSIETSEQEIDCDLTILLNISGEKLESLGKMNEARTVFTSLKDICEERKKKFPLDRRCLFLLSHSYISIGDLENAAGNVSIARDMYEKALRINQQLAQKEPNNVHVQQCLSASYERLGDLDLDAGNIKDARERFKKSMKICKRLAKREHGNVFVQRDLSNSYDRLGHLEESVGNFDAARTLYKKYQEIAQKLADNNPDDVDFQRNLCISYNRLGYLEKAAGNLADARIWYNKSLEIFKRLAEKMPDDVDAQRGLCDIYNDLGNLEIADNKPAAAKEWSNKVLIILEPLVEKTPDDVKSQWVLGRAYLCLGDSERISGNNASAKDWYEKALNVFQQLIDKMPENKELQKDLAETQEKLAQMQK